MGRAMGEKMVPVWASTGLSFHPLVQTLVPHGVATWSNLEGRAVVVREWLAADVACIVFFDGGYVEIVIGDQWNGDERLEEVRHGLWGESQGDRWL